jgi:signal transduction histidine kinase
MDAARPAELLSTSRALRVAQRVRGLRDGIATRPRTRLAGGALRYGFAVACVVAAFGARLILVPATGVGAPYVLFFSAVLAASYFAGRGPGLVASLLAAAFAARFLAYEAGYSAREAILQGALFVLETSFVALVADALRRWQHDAAESATAARQATRARDELLAVVAHDLKNPLSAIALNAASIDRRARDGDVEGVAKRVRSIEDVTGRMRRLIDDLLDASRIEAGRLKIEPQRIAVAPVIDAAVEALRPLIEQKAQTLERVCVEDGVVIAGDAERLNQVFMNLLGNAVKYTSEGGAIRVACAASPSHVTIDVADTGPGIAPQVLPRVFDRFWRADEANPGGAGLGLAIAKGVVDAHGGTIAVKSALGEGTTFTVTLPRAR